jgi:hypothetical protein
MYDGMSQLLIENPIYRHLVNSPMLPDMKMNVTARSRCIPTKNGPFV